MNKVYNQATREFENSRERVNPELKPHTINFFIKIFHHLKNLNNFTSEYTIPLIMNAVFIPSSYFNVSPGTRAGRKSRSTPINVSSRSGPLTVPVTYPVFTPLFVEYHTARQGRAGAKAFAIPFTKRRRHHCRHLSGAKAIVVPFTGLSGDIALIFGEMIFGRLKELSYIC